MAALFLAVDLSFLAANLVKIPAGGWVPILIALVVFILMATWKRGRFIVTAVLREGSEIVLFLYGMAAGGIGRGGLAVGIALGVGAGAILGFALYFGLLRIPMKHFFSVTNVMLILLAAGLASTAAGFLVQSDLLPTWGD